MRRLGNESGQQTWFMIQFDENETVGDLKTVIEGETGVDINFQDLKLGTPMEPQRTIYGDTKFLKDIEPPLPNMSAEVWLYDRRLPRRRPVLEIEEDEDPVGDTLSAASKVAIYISGFLGAILVGGQILERWLFGPPTGP